MGGQGRLFGGGTFKSRRSRLCREFQAEGTTQAKALRHAGVARARVSKGVPS